MTEPRKPALLGLTAYFLLGLTLGVTHLVAHAVLGWDAIASRVWGPTPSEIQDATALSIALYALLIFLPLLTAGIAALMGRHGGRTGQSATGAAAVITLLGVPLVWVNLAIAALLVGAILDTQGHDLFSSTVQLLYASLVQIVLITGPLVGLAAIVAHRAQIWAEHTETALGWPEQPQEAESDMGEAYGGTDPGAWETTPEPDLGEQEPLGHEPYAGAEGVTHGEDMLTDHPVDCPRCGRTFTITGARPLRIECPDCGKTGTIR